MNTNEDAKIYAVFVLLLTYTHHLNAYWSSDASWWLARPSMRTEPPASLARPFPRRGRRMDEEEEAEAVQATEATEAAAEAKAARDGAGAAESRGGAPEAASAARASSRASAAPSPADLNEGGLSKRQRAIRELKAASLAAALAAGGGGGAAAPSDPGLAMDGSGSGSGSGGGSSGGGSGGSGGNAHQAARRAVRHAPPPPLLPPPTPPPPPPDVDPRSLGVPVLVLSRVGVQDVPDADRKTAPDPYVSVQLLDGGDGVRLPPPQSWYSPDARTAPMRNTYHPQWGQRLLVPLATRDEEEEREGFVVGELRGDGPLVLGIRLRDADPEEGADGTGDDE